MRHAVAVCFGPFLLAGRGGSGAPEGDATSVRRRGEPDGPSASCDHEPDGAPAGPVNPEAATAGAGEDGPREKTGAGGRR